MNIEKEFEALKTLIEDCGELAREYYYNPENARTGKDDGTIVTEIDTTIETRLRAYVQEHFPDDTIVGEEGDDVVGTSGYVWYIDPIDGTENLVRKIPFFAITATRLGPGPEDSFAIVHNPISRQTFAALMEDGMYENENIATLTSETIGDRIVVDVANGSGKDGAILKKARYALITGLGMHYGKSGNYNSGLLEFAYVASGRLDGFLSLQHKPWDSAAGLYLVKAAGGAIHKFTNGKWELYEGSIRDLYGESYREQHIYFVSHPDIAAEVLEFIGNPYDWAERIA